MPEQARVQEIATMLECRHERRTGGNDYLYCETCGLMWDYRRGGPERGIIDLLEQERDALHSAWAELDIVLGAGGINDPAFLTGMVRSQKELLSAAEIREQRLREALKRYGRHDIGCAVTRSISGCDCGFSTALAPDPAQP